MTWREELEMIEVSESGGIFTSKLTEPNAKNIRQRCGDTDFPTFQSTWRARTLSMYLGRHLLEPGTDVQSS